MLFEPSVFWSPYFASPCACSTRTVCQSASSSSASTIARLVRMPVPISERDTTIVTCPVDAMATNRFGAKAAGSAPAWLIGDQVATRAPSRKRDSAMPFSTLRRLRFSILLITLPPLPRRGSPP